MTQAPTPGPLDSDSVKLLPCPFCEGGVIVTDSQECQDAETYYWHRCAGCGVESEGAHGASAARDQWNMRPQPFRLAPTAPVEASGSERDITGETFMGFRVAAWRYRQSDETHKLPHHYAEHWSTPGASAWGVQRLFTEDQLQQAMNLHPQPSGETREHVEAVLDRLNNENVRYMARVGGLSPWIETFKSDLRALLSAPPLALGGQQGGDDHAELIADLRRYYNDCTPSRMDYTLSDGLAFALEKAIKALSTTPARAEAQDEGAAGERKRFARIISPSAFMPETPFHSAVFQSDPLPVAREKAFAKADAIIAGRAHPSPPPAADEDRVREAIADVISHESDWRGALMAMDAAEETPEDGSGKPGYWLHQIKVLDRILTALKSTAAKEGEKHDRL